MKRIMDTIKHRSRREKVLVIAAIIALASLPFTLQRSKASSDSVYSHIQVAEGLSFENGKIEYNDGISTYTANVINNNKTTYNLKYIEITFTKSDNISETLIAYIGNSIDSNEAKILTASIDDDIRGVTKIDFNIVK